MITTTWPATETLLTTGSNDPCISSASTPYEWRQSITKVSRSLTKKCVTLESYVASNHGPWRPEARMRFRWKSRLKSENVEVSNSSGRIAHGIHVLRGLKVVLGKSLRREPTSARQISNSVIYWTEPLVYSVPTNLLLEHCSQFYKEIRSCRLILALTPQRHLRLASTLQDVYYRLPLCCFKTDVHDPSSSMISSLRPHGCHQYVGPIHSHVVDNAETLNILLTLRETMIKCCYTHYI